MLNELNSIANDLLALHGYRTHPLQWRGEASGVGVTPPRPIVPRAPARVRATPLHAADGNAGRMASVHACAG